MFKNFYKTACISCSLVFNLVAFGQVQYSTDTLLMGSTFRFTAVETSPESAYEAINSGIDEVIRIEDLISSWDTLSQTHEINKNAGIKPVAVDEELFSLIERSLKISEITNGYFDISFASIDKIWDFNKNYEEPPSDALILKSVELINYENIVLNRARLTVFLTKKGMKIGFGAIGKGYAANRAKAVMQSRRISSGVVNAGGDLISWGNKADESSWTVGIAEPLEKGKIRMWLDASDMAVVTSGNYERYVLIQGKRYCHIINPKTGWPVSGLSSVSIVCPDAELADALATSVFVLGKDEGLALINRMNGIECIVIDEDGKIYFSQNLETNYIKMQE